MSEIRLCCFNVFSIILFFQTKDQKLHIEYWQGSARSKVFQAGFMPLYYEHIPPESMKKKKVVKADEISPVVVMISGIVSDNPLTPSSSEKPSNNENDSGYTSTPVPHETLVEDRMCHNLQAPLHKLMFSCILDIGGLMPVDEQSPGITSDSTLMPVTQESPVEENHMCDNVWTPSVGENPTDYDNNSNIVGLILVDKQPLVITELHMNVDQGMAHKLIFSGILDVRGFIPVDEQLPVITEPQVHPIDQGMTSDSMSTHVSHEPPIEEDHKDTVLDINGIPTLLEPISEGMESVCGHSLSKPADQLTMPGGVQMCMPTPLGGLSSTNFNTYSTLDINGLQTRMPAPLEHHSSANGDV
ncbi:hypothetical protein BDQ17DRAFT_1331617 [Cyathus striatus]|nr:hypothetical protein BDQ17DRAFT_1331617 [Cyathus striatus]